MNNNLKLIQSQAERYNMHTNSDILKPSPDLHLIQKTHVQIFVIQRTVKEINYSQ